MEIVGNMTDSDMVLVYFVGIMAALCLVLGFGIHKYPHWRRSCATKKGKRPNPSPLLPSVLPQSHKQSTVIAV